MFNISNEAQKNIKKKFKIKYSNEKNNQEINNKFKFSINNNKIEISESKKNLNINKTSSLITIKEDSIQISKSILNQNDLKNNKKIHFELSLENNKKNINNLNNKKLHIKNISYLNNFNDNYSSGRWKEDEHKRFLEAIIKYGNDWKEIEKYVKTRSSTQARSHAQKFFLKIKKDKNPEMDIINKNSIKSLNEILSVLNNEDNKKLFYLLNKYSLEKNEYNNVNNRIYKKNKKKNVIIKKKDNVNNNNIIINNVNFKEEEKNICIEIEEKNKEKITDFSNKNNNIFNLNNNNNNNDFFDINNEDNLKDNKINNINYIKRKRRKSSYYSTEFYKNFMEEKDLKFDSYVNNNNNNINLNDSELLNYIQSRKISFDDDIINFYKK